MENVTDVARFAPRCKLFVLVIGHFLLDCEITRPLASPEGTKMETALPARETAPDWTASPGRQPDKQTPVFRHPFSASFTFIPLHAESGPSRSVSG